ncbi:oxidoreductase [Jeotgalicoccus coquinae]|uniref:NADH-flavin reductase n=1 Tax=Jeotgalicoccus coquinae TaxID=709509 RepID=A0A6V7RQ41_9STAP|nr:SDR family oxidoreductase [Jeotgalicoccus coquinae]MBB6422085.1 putative NADH-flavin reductase [Jeotgalicoccus coquinae]GGE18890.1 oxidoreductase [Jeotgalicoccus coquinae]CAD2079821.1 NmrA-like family protein [Jeotgalicoccus coquinae]
MNILLLGMTGRTGSEIAKLALEDKHQVTALVRTPEKITVNDENLSIIKGNVTVKVDIERAVKNADVVISALNTDGGAALTQSMPLIIDAMNAEGIKRIVTIGTAGILQSRVESDVLRYQSSESKRKLTRAAEEHHKTYLMLEESELDWTVVCPTYLPDGEAVGKCREERDFLPEGGKKITVGDTAVFVYKQLESDEYIKSRVGIAY